MYNTASKFNFDELDNAGANLSHYAVLGDKIDVIKWLHKECSKSRYKNVLKTPEPRVRFREFANHGLRLQLLFWIHRPEIRGRTLDAVNTEIYKKLANRESLKLKLTNSKS